MGGQQHGCTSNGSTASKFQRFTQSAQFWKSRMPLLLHDLQGTSRLWMLKLVKVLRTVDLHLKRLLPFCSFVRAVPHKKRGVHQKRGSCAVQREIITLASGQPAPYSAFPPPPCPVFDERDKTPKSQDQSQEGSGKESRSNMSLTFTARWSLLLSYGISCLRYEMYNSMIASYRIMRGQKVRFVTLGASS